VQCQKASNELTQAKVTTTHNGDKDMLSGHEMKRLDMYKCIKMHGWKVEYHVNLEEMSFETK
jgi:hypothetical protein